MRRKALVFFAFAVLLAILVASCLPKKAEPQPEQVLCEKQEIKEIDFAVLNDVYLVLKDYSVYREYADDPDYLLRSAHKNFWALLSVAEEQIPQWSKDIIEKEIIGNGSKVDFGVMNEVYKRAAQDPQYSRLNTPEMKEELLKSSIGDGHNKTGIIGAMGDPFAGYVTAQAYKLGETESLKGTYVGIGSYIKKNEKGEYELKPLKGSPAEKSGVKAGDVVLKVDGKTVQGCDLPGLISHVKGKPGTQTTLSIRHLNGLKEEIVVTREEIKQKHVQSWPGVDLQDGRGLTSGDLSYDFPFKDRNGNSAEGIVYIKILEFSSQMQRDLQIVLENTDWSSARGLIIDLRNNPGGFLNVTGQAIDWFLPKGQVILITQKSNGTKTRYTSTGNTLVPADVPIVILVGHEKPVIEQMGTYSAAEVFSAALAENGRAILVGERSGGKGTVNDYFALRKGEYGALYIAIELWLTPNGNHIEPLNSTELGGLKPAIGVEWTDEDYYKRGKNPDYDPVILTAIDVLRE